MAREEVIPSRTSSRELGAHGYTYRDDEFYFNAGNHDDEMKVIFGADNDGDDFVDLIFAAAAASDFICEKLTAST